MAFRSPFRPASGRNPSRSSFPTACYSFSSSRPAFVLFAFLALSLTPTRAFASTNVGAGSSSVACTPYYEANVAYNYTSKTVEYCNGTAWTNLISSGTTGGINLGTSASTTNPQVSGDATTGLFSAATSTVSIATGGVQRMTVDSSGYVGIGTATPANKLDISGAIAIGTSYAGVSAAPANGMIVVGSVGIGTSAPLAPLHVKSLVEPILAERATTVGASPYSIGVARLRLSGNVGNGLGNGLIFDLSDAAANSVSAGSISSYWVNNSTDLSAMAFNLNVPGGPMYTTAVMTLYPGGLVGIGSTSPAATLDVNGYARLSLNSSAPATCSTSNEGAIALTHLAQVCVCDTTPAWHILNTGTACSW